jgi:hypothetical protein
MGKYTKQLTGWGVGVVHPDDSEAETVLRSLLVQGDATW